MESKRLRIFISSPGDVGEERVLANKLVQRLSDEFAGALYIEAVFWEHEPLNASSTFQAQILPPHDCEVAICILWTRLGTRLPPDICRTDGSTYSSGTEYEFEDAFESFKKIGRPELLVYRKRAKSFVSQDDTRAARASLDQKDALDRFVTKWFVNPDGSVKAAYHSFKTAADFEILIDQHLRKLIHRHLSSGGQITASAKLTWPNGSPFRGLEVFEFEHAPIFFGRTRAVGDALSALRSNAAARCAFLLIVGVSGGGKSSLVRAGLLPLLVQPGVIEGVELWRRAVLRPSDAGTPLHSLAAALLADPALPELGADGTTVEELARLLTQDPASAAGLIKGALSQAAGVEARKQGLDRLPAARLALVVDQAEEIFTLFDVTVEQRQTFSIALSSLARGGRVWVIVTLRGDFYHRLFELPELIALQGDSGQYALPLPTGSEIGQIICQPARAAGLMFETDPATNVSLDEVLREAASASPESLPLLEFAMQQLYARKTAAGLLIYAAYHEMGGVEGALAQRAEAVFALLSADVQATLPQVVRALVSIGNGGAVARQQAAMTMAAPTPAAQSLVDAFVRARLFSADRTEVGHAVVRVTHEALLRNWPRVVQCVEQDKELLIVRSRVSQAAARWVAEGRPADLLLGDGKPLAEAESLAEGCAAELDPAVHELIAASRERQTSILRQQQRAHAATLLRRLLDADTAQVASIIGEMSSCREWVDPLLREENVHAAIDSRQRLRTSLALIDIDDSQVDYLLGRLLTAEPSELLLIRGVLRPAADRIIGRLWSLAQTPSASEEATRLRAAAALAIYSPDDSEAASLWAKCASAVVHDLVRENPIFLSYWIEAFRPVRNRLLGALMDIFRDSAPERATERNLATNLLAEYADSDVRILAELLMDSDERQFVVIYSKLEGRVNEWVGLLADAIEHTQSGGTMLETPERLAKRQANAAVALLKVGRTATVWPLLRHRPDPRVRSHLVHRLSTLGVEPKVIVDRLEEELDVSIRRALVLSLGKFAAASFKAYENLRLLGYLRHLYTNESDPGLRAAAEWLLRGREQHDWLRAADEQSAADDTARESTIRVLTKTMAGGRTGNTSPRWYVNCQGQTMVIIPGPMEFWMGSPSTETNRQDYESRHRRRIGRSFALATKPVTVEEYRIFEPFHALPAVYTRMPGLPAVGISCHQAASYCNWLSGTEGIPESQWCYEVEDGRVVRLKKGYLQLVGYRLPTEAEMEYATRAGTTTSRYYGETEELLTHYAWYLANSLEESWPVGGKMPNDLGLFDMHGNVWCWCQGTNNDYPRQTDDEVAEDNEDASQAIETDRPVMRGGSFLYQASYIRSACRNDYAPTGQNYNTGFRPARTIGATPIRVAAR